MKNFQTNLKLNNNEIFKLRNKLSDSALQYDWLIQFCTGHLFRITWNVSWRILFAKFEYTKIKKVSVLGQVFTAIFYFS